jgi:uncharacterized protein YjbI with pentapeptide repeats
MKKYKFIENSLTIIQNNVAVELRQIQAIKDFNNINIRTIGGFISSESDLKHDDGSWICKNSYLLNSSLRGDIFLENTSLENTTISGCGKLRNSSLFEATLQLKNNSKIENSELTFVNSKGKINILSSNLMGANLNGNVYIAESFLNTNLEKSLKTKFSPKRLPYNILEGRIRLKWCDLEDSILLGNINFKESSIYSTTLKGKHLRYVNTTLKEGMIHKTSELQKYHRKNINYMKFKTKHGERKIIITSPKEENIYLLPG